MLFEQLYHSYKNLVFNLALQYVQNVSDAEEITQDVFLTVYKKLNTFKQEASFSTWIYRITINKSLDFLKAKKRQKRFAFFTTLFFENGEEKKYANQSFNHPGIELENKEAIEKIFSCINQLPDNQKTALILSKIEQKSQIEIAEIMGLSPKAVESLVQRAKVNLSKMLNENEGK